MKILLDKKETSQAVSLSESTIARMVKNNCFPSPIEIGTRVLWRVKDIEKWADSLRDDHQSLQNPVDHGQATQKKRAGRKRLAV
jgi:predicted DNA-binding transcriptional regulator AlpA